MGVDESPAWSYNGLSRKGPRLQRRPKFQLLGSLNSSLKVHVSQISFSLIIIKELLKLRILIKKK